MKTPYTDITDLIRKAGRTVPPGVRIEADLRRVVGMIVRSSLNTSREARAGALRVRASREVPPLQLCWDAQGIWQAAPQTPIGSPEPGIRVEPMTPENLTEVLRDIAAGVSDPSEAARREAQAEIESSPRDRSSLEAEYGQVWTGDEMRQEFEITSFLAPFVMVRRRRDGKRGTMTFQHSPRFYWGFQEE